MTAFWATPADGADRAVGLEITGGGHGHAAGELAGREHVDQLEGVGQPGRRADDLAGVDGDLERQLDPGGEAHAEQRTPVVAPAEGGVDLDHPSRPVDAQVEDVARLVGLDAGDHVGAAGDGLRSSIPTMTSSASSRGPAGSVGSTSTISAPSPRSVKPR